MLMEKGNWYLVFGSESKTPKSKAKSKSKAGVCLPCRPQPRAAALHEFFMEISWAPGMRVASNGAKNRD
jgi:hypothetical protein